MIVGQAEGVPHLKLVAAAPEASQTVRAAGSASALSPRSALSAAGVGRVAADVYDPGKYCSGNPYGFRKTDSTTLRSVGLMRQ